MLKEIYFWDSREKRRVLHFGVLAIPLSSLAWNYRRNKYIARNEMASLFRTNSGVLASSRTSQNFGNFNLSRAIENFVKHDRYAKTYVIFVIDRDRL